MSYVTPDQPYEPRRWEGQVVNGTFPLRKFLGGSKQSAVFLSEYKAGNLADVAIKLVPAVASRAEAQLARWRTVAALSHPHLVRLFDQGRCQLDGREFLFVVMEHADQTLAQVLARRALSPDEAREFLLPTLDALVFLHGNQLVHARLKPSNLLAIDDQLKLASDAVCQPGHSVTVSNSAYDAPELKAHGASTAGDVWSLGVTLVEALTQRTPTWSDEKRQAIALPASIPAPFARTVKRCLSLSPDIRPSVIELQAQYNPTPTTAHVTSDHQPPTSESLRDVIPSQPSAFAHRLLLALAVLLFIALAVWIGLQPSGKSSQRDLPPRAVPAPVPAPALVASVSTVMPAEPKPEPESVPEAEPEAQAALEPESRAESQPEAEPLPVPPPTAPSALVEVSPEVSRDVLDRMKGRVFVTVRVLVDPAGDVIGVFMESAGSSRYFARVAEEAAREWKFAPVGERGTRVWLLRFEFSRDGINSRATAV